jgi:hypothetical protein
VRGHWDSVGELRTLLGYKEFLFSCPAPQGLSDSNSVLVLAKALSYLSENNPAKKDKDDENSQDA